MTKVLLILAVLAVAFWVFTIVDCSAQPAIRHRGVGKPVWILIVVLLPVIGGVMWLVLGRSRVNAAGSRSAPDDDLEFLGRIGTQSDQDERIRRLEEELAQLDAEDDDPKWNRLSAPPATGSPGPAKPGEAATPGTEAKGRPSPDDDDTRGQRGVAG
ncbi:PLD nuclease N-terminal domain-containing protein [Microbacterium sp. AZCO]|uniref:PLD nuclease N-terminal domain-containing protein n=1 Tax=Microbacterium sp. AZCO TaxID=3142976 RepID=UPI0031F40AFB